MKMKKCHLEDISSMIFQGYLTTDIFINDTFFIIKSLTTEEREDVSLRFKYLSKSYNFYLILELLSYSVKFVGGHNVEKNKIKKFLLSCRSIIPLFLFDQYNEIEKRIDECSKFIDYYIDTNESKYYWGIFKNTSRNIDIEKIKNVNQFQYYWIVSNVVRDKTEEEKRSWSKTEYMTNTICAFINPKAYSKTKRKMGISDQFELDHSTNNETLKILESDGEVEVSERIEKKQEESTDTSQSVFHEMKRHDNESEDEHKIRVNEMMKKQCSGEINDEHDKIVRDYEVNILKGNLIKKRKEIEIYKYLKEIRKNQNDDPEYTDDFIEKIDEEQKSKGYFHNGISYFEIVSQRGFSSIPKKEKQRIFDEMMTIDLDIENAANLFLKNLYPDNSSQDSNTDNLNNNLIDNKGNIVQDNLRSSNESTNENKHNSFKNAAQKAANMNISVKEKDLVKEKTREEKEKKFRIQKMLETRNQALQIEEKQLEDLDQMIF